MKKMRKMFNKAVSMVVVVCFMIGIINIPVYAQYNVVSSIQTTDAVLAQPYYTPAQLASKVSVEPVVKGTSPSKPKATKSKVTKSQVTKLASKITTKINSLLKKKTTSSLAKTWLKKTKTLVNNIKNGKKTNAAKYTWLTKALTAINAISKAKTSVLSLAQQTAASGSVFSSLKSVLKNNKTYKLYINYVKPSITAIDKLLKKKLNTTAKNWLKKAKNIINNTISGTKSNSQKTSLLKQALSSIKAVVKKNASIAVLKQQSKGIFASLKKIVDSSSTNTNNTNTNTNTGDNTNNNDNNGNNTNNNNDNTDDNNNNTTDKPYQQKLNESKNLINNLLNDQNTSALAKEWLNKASSLIDGIVNSNKTEAEKEELINKALTSIQNVSNNNCLMEVLEQESAEGGVFSSLQTTVLENSATYRIYKKEQEVNSLIANLTNKEETSDLAKEWLQAAQTAVNEISNSNKTEAEKEELINKALTSIQNVSNNNCSMETLEQESAEGGVFSSLQTTVLENNAEYQVYQITKTYSEESVAVINEFSEKTGLNKNEVLQQFAKAGVTSEQLTAVIETLSDKINNGETFINSSAVALSKYLKTDEKLIAVQQLAVAIANGSNINNNLSGSNNSISLGDQLTVAKLNGSNSTDVYNYSLDEFMETLRDGESAVIYTSPSRSIIVTKQNDDSYTIVDIGQKINSKPAIGICNAEEFKKIMNGKSTSIKFNIDPSFGFSYSTNFNVFYNAVNSDGKVSFISNSKGIKEKEEQELNSEYVEPAITLINNLLSTEGTSQLAKMWLNKAKEIVNGIINDNNNVSDEETQLKEVLASIQRVAEQNASIAVLIQESTNDGAFASLQEDVLNKNENVKNVIYPIFEQYAQPVVSAINNLLKNNNDLNESAQVWLNDAANLVASVMDEIVTATNQGKDCSQQKQWLQQALVSLETIKNENASIEVLIQETSEGKAFAQLRQNLENTATYQAYQRYGNIGVSVIRSLAKYINVLESVVFQQFVRYDVNLNSLTAQIGRDNLNVGELLLDQIQKGTNLFNCVSLAMSKFLNISRTFAGLQDLAADIALGWYSYFNSNEYTLISTSDAAELKVLKENGIEATNYNYVFSLDNFMSNFQIGAKTFFHVTCFNAGGHTILVSKEGPDSFGVCDVNLNKGNKVIFTASEFEQLMNGQGNSITGKDAITGENVTREIYYKAINSSGKVSFIAIAESVQDMLQMAA